MAVTRALDVLGLMNDVMHGATRFAPVMKW